MSDNDAPEMVDRVAQAIIKAESRDDVRGWAMARAAITAMREPTEEMLRATDAAMAEVNERLAEMAERRLAIGIGDRPAISDRLHAWRAMIDAALGETK